MHWKNIKSYFSERDARFRVHGVLSIKNHNIDSKRFISTKLSDARTEEICAKEDAIGSSELSDI